MAVMFSSRSHQALPVDRRAIDDATHVDHETRKRRWDKLRLDRAHSFDGSPFISKNDDVAAIGERRPAKLSYSSLSPFDSTLEKIERLPSQDSDVSDQDSLESPTQQSGYHRRRGSILVPSSAVFEDAYCDTDADAVEGDMTVEVYSPRFQAALDTSQSGEAEVNAEGDSSCICMEFHDCSRRQDLCYVSANEQTVKKLEGEVYRQAVDELKLSDQSSNADTEPADPAEFSPLAAPALQKSVSFNPNAEAAEIEASNPNPIRTCGEPDGPSAVSWQPPTPPGHRHTIDHYAENNALNQTMRPQSPDDVWRAQQIDATVSGSSAGEVSAANHQVEELAAQHLDAINSRFEDLVTPATSEGSKQSQLNGAMAGVQPELSANCPAVSDSDRLDSMEQGLMGKSPHEHPVRPVLRQSAMKSKRMKELVALSAEEP